MRRFRRHSNRCLRLSFPRTWLLHLRLRLPRPWHPRLKCPSLKRPSLRHPRHCRLARTLLHCLLVRQFAPRLVCCRAVREARRRRRSPLPFRLSDGAARCLAFTTCRALRRHCRAPSPLDRRHCLLRPWSPVPPRLWITHSRRLHSKPLPPRHPLPSRLSCPRPTRQELRLLLRPQACPQGMPLLRKPPRPRLRCARRTSL